MAELDATALSQRMLKIGLITEPQLQEAWMELGQRGGEAEPFLRFCERKGFVTAYQSQKLLKGDLDGYLLGGYRVLYKIASGSFGRVYRAEEPGSGTIVAIKVLRRRWSEDDHTIDLFEREGRVGLGLRHPNVVETLAVSQDPITKQYYIVMEFVEGGNLRDFLRIRGRLEAAEALRILEEAASGLAHAYSRGVTHRDIKLTNVLISSQGVAKLVDFGLAGIFTRKGLELQSSERMDRTVDYAGLEKRTGVKPGDIRSDIYFLGAVMYEMLTGRSPLLMTKDPRVRMSPHRFDSVQPMAKNEIDAPASVYQLVERMMSLEPRYRYQTPSQLLDAIREAHAEIHNDPTSVAAKPQVRSVFVVETKSKLQNALREAFKAMGFRVFMAAAPERALDRYIMQPFDALVIDAGATSEDGRFTFDRILKESEAKAVPCAGVLILNENQADWGEDYAGKTNAAALVRPVTMKQVCRKIEELLSAVGQNVTS